MNAFPIFEDKSYASKLWDRIIRWWPDDEIRLRFVEEGKDNYWFILYNTSKFLDENTGFAKKLQLSDNYRRFKAGYEKRAILRFGIYKTKFKKVEKGKDKEKFDLELLKKHKTIYDIQFVNFSDLATNSIEMGCIINEGKRLNVC